MKKQLKFLPVMLAFLVLGACSSDDPADITPEPDPAEVGITSFGFYADDNQDVLFADYVEDEISGKDIEIALPEEVDFSNLVARFTTTDGDEVSVQGTPQISGETANDFSAPVEYLVSEGNSNTIYTVTVKKMASAVWSQLPGFDGHLVSNASLKVNPESYAPYVAFVSQMESDADEKLNLISFDEDQWDYVGSKDFSPGRARSVDLAFNRSGVPFVSFGDDSGDQTEAAVMTYDSGSWSYLGGGPFSEVESSVNAVTVGEEGEVYGFYINEQRGHANRRGVELKVFDGGWSDLSISGRSGNALDVIAKEVNGDIYLGVHDFGERQAVSVYKYSNGSWSTLADRLKESEEHIVYRTGFAMDVDRDGNVFVAYVEKGPDTPQQHKVQRYDAQEGVWSAVGSIVHSTESTLTIRSFDIAVDPYGNPMFFFRNDNSNPVVAHFDADTNNWGDLINLSSGEADELELEVAPNGVAYASYLVDDQLYVHKLASPDNQ